MTSNLKWDGVGFCPKDNNLTPVLVEMSGGLCHNNSQSKNTNDICKLVPGAIKSIQYIAAITENHPISEYIVRFFRK